MADEDEIVQKIKIEAEGADDAAAEFKKIGEAAEDAAKQIEKAGESGGEGFEKAGKSAEEAAEGFEKAGEAAGKLSSGFENFGEAAGKVSEGVDSIVKSVGEVSEAGEKAASSIKSFAEIAGEDAVSSLRSLGLSAGELMGALEGIGGSSEGFQELTSSIQKLGSTAEEALGGAQEAAKAFGATATDLGVVQGIIEEVAAQAKASGVSFSDMAGKFDEARASLVASATEASGGITHVGESVNGAKQSVEDFAAAIVSLQAADVSGSLQGVATSADAVGGSTEEASKALDNMNTAATVLSGGIDILNAKNILAARSALDAGKGGAQAAAALTQVGTAAAQSATLAAQASAIFARVGVNLTSGATAAASAAARMAQETTRAALAAGAYGSSFGGLNAALTSLTERLTVSRSEMRAFSASARLLGVPIPGVISVLSSLLRVLGPVRATLIAVGAAGAGLIKLGSDAASATKAMEGLAKSAGTSFAEMKRGEETFKALGGSAKEFQKTFSEIVKEITQDAAKMRDALADSSDKTASGYDRQAEARMKLAEAQAKVSGGEEAAKEQREANQRERDLRAAATAAREYGAATREAASQAANDLKSVVGVVKQLEAGMKNVRFDEATTIQTKVAAVKEAMRQAKDEGRNFVDTLLRILASMSKADAKALGEALKVPPGVVEELHKVGVNIEEIIAKSRSKISLDIEPPDHSTFKAMEATFGDLKKAWGEFVESVSKSPLGAAAAGLTTAFMEFATGLLQALTLALKGITALIDGLTSLVDLFGKARDASANWANASWASPIIKFINELIDRMNVLLALVLNDVTRAFLGLFGVKWSDKDAKDLENTIRGVKEQAKDAAVSTQNLGTQVGQLGSQLGQLGSAGVPAVRGLSLSANQLSQMFKAGAIDALEYGRRLKELEKIKGPTFDLTKQALKDGIIDTGEFARRLRELQQTKPPTFDELLNMFKIGIIDAVELARRVRELEGVKPQPIPDPLRDASAGADQYGRKLGEVQQQLSQTKEAPKTDWDATIRGADQAASGIRGSFANTLQAIGVAAKESAQGVADAFKSIRLELNFEGIVKAAEAAAKDVEKAFGGIELKLDFKGVVSDAESAARDIQQRFSSITLTGGEGLTLNFAPVIAAAQLAGQQIGQAIQNAVAAIDLTALAANIATTFATILTTAQTAFFGPLVEAARIAAQGIQTAINSISFAGLITQIGAVITAFQNMEKAANAAAQAAASAAASGASEFHTGGLFRGRPGTDTNLAWLTDYEFIMRPEAVMKYGVEFMRMINSLSFPSNGFRGGGLNRVMHSISNLSAFRDGGLVMPRISIPAFAAGGINENSGGAGRGAAKSQNMRPLNLTIGGETFRNMLAPEDTAKALERAAVGRQVSATGVRPRWNK